MKQLNVDTGDDYAFALRDEIRVLEREEVISANIGGVEIDLLVDSGSRCNIIDQKTWESLKSRGIRCTSRKVSKIAFPYGKKEEIKIFGEFDCEIKVGNKVTRTVFKIFRGEGRPLMGIQTAKELNILDVRIHLQINQVKSNAKCNVKLGDKFLKA